MRVMWGKGGGNCGESECDVGEGGGTVGKVR